MTDQITMVEDYFGKWYQKYDSRKLLFALLIFIVCSYLRYIDKLDNGGYVSITIALITTYIAGNVAQKWVESKRGTVN